MPPSRHVKKAYAAMEALGIDPARVKPVLKNLLATYEKNWELIAEDNYSVLADAIFDEKETEVSLLVSFHSLVFKFSARYISFFVITLTFHHIDITCEGHSRNGRKEKEA